MLPCAFSSEDPALKEDSALARWAADPANTAWMESEYCGLWAPCQALLLPPIPYQI